MNVACDYEAPMQMLTTEKYIAGGTSLLRPLWRSWRYLSYFRGAHTLFFQTIDMDGHP